jgi:pimeloyl-ACP methyl ester carboxylesterase
VLTLAEGHAVLVFDLLGFGESERREGMDTSVPAQARALPELIELRGLETPAIAGHDIGGAIVLRTHLLEDVPFDRIALIDAVALHPWITLPPGTCRPIWRRTSRCPTTSSSRP